MGFLCLSKETRQMHSCVYIFKSTTRTANLKVLHCQSADMYQTINLKIKSKFNLLWNLQIWLSNTPEGFSPAQFCSAHETSIFSLGFKQCETLCKKIWFDSKNQSPLALGWQILSILRIFVPWSRACTAVLLFSYQATLNQNCIQSLLVLAKRSGKKVNSDRNISDSTQTFLQWKVTK